MAVNKVEINGDTVVDLTEDTVSPDTLLEGETAHDKSGAIITGRLMMPVISVGGRNWLRNTKTMSTFVRYNNASVKKDVDGFAYLHLPAGPPLSASSGHVYISSRPFIQFAFVRGKEVTLSFLLRSEESMTTTSTRGFAIEFSIANSTGTSRSKFRLMNINGVEVGTGWTKYSYTATLIDSFFTSGSGTIDSDSLFYIQVYNTSLNFLDIKQVKLELGNIATDWTPAPADKQDVYTQLWRNASPASEFSNQTVVVPNLGDYETFIIYYRQTMNIDYRASSMARIPVGSSMTVTMSCLSVADDTSILLSARIATINRSNGTVTFGVGRSIKGTMTSDDDTHLIPVEIYGIPE